MYDKNFYNKTLSSISIKQLADLIECELDNTTQSGLLIKGVNSLEKAEQGDITFLSNKKYLVSLDITNASACIISKELSVTPQSGIVLLRSKNPYYSYTKAINLFYKVVKQYKTQIVSSAFVSEQAKIGKNCYIGHNVVISDGVEIGDDSIIEANSFIDNNVTIGKRARIGPNVSLSFTNIGDDVVILAGARIGTDGFGFSTHLGKHHKILHIGRVLIGNDVEIGANTTIDRGSLNDTIIEDGVRIDNLVQIAHNVTIGKGSVLAGMVGIAGSTEIGQYCLIGGQVGMAGHLKLGNQVQIAGGSGVGEDIGDKQIWGGYPAMQIRQWHRLTILQKKLLEQHQKRHI